jgi:hypothetical protein
MSSKYELSNLSSSESTVVGEDKMSGKDGGCYVRTATGMFCFHQNLLLKTFLNDIKLIQNLGTFYKRGNDYLTTAILRKSQEWQRNSLVVFNVSYL